MESLSGGRSVKKVLIVASVISFIEWFNRDNITYFLDNLQCEVHIACNMDYMEDTDEKRTKEYIEYLSRQGVVLHNIEFARAPINPANIQAFNKLREIIINNQFSMIHCHTPTASIITRFAAAKARKKGTVVVYTAHGFHFFKGAPKKNWLVFYPIEKICSLLTDVLITITKEDYVFSRKNLHAKKTVYVPGVGVDIDKFQCTVDVKEKKRSLGVDDEEFIVLSVGELNENKNHETVIRALAQLSNPRIRYMVAGKGDKEAYLRKLAADSGVKLDLLGFRRDIPELIRVADVFAFPSHREGLSKALMEAMAAGLPCVVSSIRGNVDLIDENGGYLCNSHDATSFARAVSELYVKKELRGKMGTYNAQKVKIFSRETVNKKMFEIYDSIVGKIK